MRTFKHSGFTLIEALVATSITAIAGSALLLGLGSSLETTNMALEQTVAAGMAQQIMDEIAGQRYMAVGESPQQWPLGPNDYERGSAGRERYNDIDDYNGYYAQPAKDPWGVPLGTEAGQGAQRHSGLRATDFFTRWRHEVEAYYVSPTNHSTRLTGSQRSNFRAVEVRVLFNDPVRGLRLITQLRRVFAYVPAP